MKKKREKERNGKENRIFFVVWMEQKQKVKN